jgi:hypothetical protein
VNFPTRAATFCSLLFGDQARLPCTQTDGRAPKAKQMGQPGRPFSAHRRGSDARSSRVIEGNFSWVNHYQLKSNCHEIPLQQTALNFRSLQNPASGFPALLKSYGRTRRHRTSITLPASLSAVATLGSKPRTIRRPAHSSGSCTPIKVGGFSNTSWATASNRGGPTRFALANVRRPMSSAASSCSFRFTISPPITGEWSSSNTERMTPCEPQGVIGGLTHNPHSAPANPGKTF